MGYTNYWNQPTDFTDEEWDAVVKEFKYVCDIGKDFIHEVTVSKEQSPSISFTFNVKDTYDTPTYCKSFYIGKRAYGSTNGKQAGSFTYSDITIDYCETNANAIDIYVWHMLTFCQMIKEDFTCDRDRWYWEKPKHGNNETNSIAVVWNIDDVRQALGEAELPEDFLDNDECMQVLRRVEYHLTEDWEYMGVTCDALEEEFEEKISDYRNKQKESEHD